MLLPNNDITFSFTGKERDAETGYSYFGARYYDSDLSGLFLSVDPMADKYPGLSPYAYCAWNPLRLLDPDGREMTDFYDISTGEQLKHVDDGIDEAIAINHTVFNICERVGTSTSFTKNLGFSLGKNSEFVAFAGTLYAESTSGQNSFEEMAAIGSVVRNMAIAEGSSIYEVISSRKSGIYGYKSREKINDSRANPDKVNLAYKAAIITLLTKMDYSHGAYYWQGRDFSHRGSAAYEQYYETGFNFTSPSHDIYNMGSHSIGGPVPYKYESTAAAAGTIFMRLTESWKKAHGSTKWDGR